ncbi:MFS transporter (plasmid) [Variovorax sp. 375MFSha3.1]
MNVGFAKLQMKDALGFSDAVFGLGAGILFVGYGLLEVPSNLLMARIGARKTFFRIMVLWGLTAAATAFVRTPIQFYVVRFFLGVFEAGFFPGVILYLSYWFPASRRGRAVALFCSASSFIGILSGPLNGATMKYFHHVAGLEGWQWLYLTQGLPAVVLGVVVFLLLKDRPTPGGWLSEEECKRIQHNLATDASDQSLYTAMREIRQLLRTPIVWALACASFLDMGAIYSWFFWLPTFIRNLGISDLLLIGMVTSVSSLIGVIGAIAMGWHSDLRKDRRWHYLMLNILSATGLLASTLTASHLVPSLVAVVVVGLGMAASWPLLAVAMTECLPRKIASAGIALVSSLGILGGAVFPAAFGYLNTRTGGTNAGVYLVAVLLLGSSLILFAALSRRPEGRRQIEPEAARCPNA